MTGKSKVVLKTHDFTESVTKQHVEIKVGIYLCLITKAATSVLLCYMYKVGHIRLFK